MTREKASLLSSVQAVSFDAGGTLLRPYPSVGQIYAAIAAEYGCLRLAPDALNLAFVKAWKATSQFDYSRDAWDDLIRRTFAQVGVSPLPTGLTHALYVRFRDPDVWEVFQDVRPTLERLRSAGLSLALISNWDERLAPLMHELGLADYFDVIVISHDHQSQKPDPRLFQTAIQGLQISPHLTLHIGDSWEEDIRGAQQSGLGAVWLQRNTNAKAPPSTEIPLITSLKELFASPMDPEV